VSFSTDATNRPNKGNVLPISSVGTKRISVERTTCPAISQPGPGCHVRQNHRYAASAERSAHGDSRAVTVIASSMNEYRRKGRRMRSQMRPIRSAPRARPAMKTDTTTLDAYTVLPRISLSKRSQTTSSISEHAPETK